MSALRTRRLTGTPAETGDTLWSPTLGTVIYCRPVTPDILGADGPERVGTVQVMSETGCQGAPNGGLLTVTTVDVGVIVEA